MLEYKGAQSAFTKLTDFGKNTIVKKASLASYLFWFIGNVLATLPMLKPCTKIENTTTA